MVRSVQRIEFRLNLHPILYIKGGAVIFVPPLVYCPQISALPESKTQPFSKRRVQIYV